MINWRLMSHPLNWVTIWLMLFLAGLALHFAMQALGIKPPQKSSTVAPPSSPSTNQAGLSGTPTGS